MVMGLSSSRKRRERDEAARRTQAYLATLTPAERARYERDQNIVLGIMIGIVLAVVGGLLLLTTLFPPPKNAPAQIPSTRASIRPGPVLP